jgi:hypothetical protein
MNGGGDIAALRCAGHTNSSPRSRFLLSIGATTLKRSGHFADKELAPPQE